MLLMVCYPKRVQAIRRIETRMHGVHDLERHVPRPCTPFDRGGVQPVDV